MRTGYTVFGLATFGAKKRYVRNLGITEFALTFQEPYPAILTNIRSRRSRGATFGTVMLYYRETTFRAKKGFFGKLCITIRANIGFLTG
jgi:hypothetical protein